MVHQRPAGHRPGARHHLEQALGQPGGEGEFGQPQRGERGRLGGFEQDGVAGREGGCEAPGGDRHREVPRRDHPDHADRFAEGDVQPAGHRDLAPGQPFHSPGRVLQQVADVAGLPGGVADGVAGLGDLQGGEFGDVHVHLVGEAPQQPGPFAGRQGGPAALGRDGAPHGGVELPGRGVGQGGEDLAGGGVADGAGGGRRLGEGGGGRVDGAHIRSVDGAHIRSKDR